MGVMPALERLAVADPRLLDGRSGRLLNSGDGSREGGERLEPWALEAELLIGHSRIQG